MGVGDLRYSPCTNQVGTRGCLRLVEFRFDSRRICSGVVEVIRGRAGPYRRVGGRGPGNRARRDACPIVNGAAVSCSSSCVDCEVFEGPEIFSRLKGAKQDKRSFKQNIEKVACNINLDLSLSIFGTELQFKAVSPNHQTKCCLWSLDLRLNK